MAPTKEELEGQVAELEQRAADAEQRAAAAEQRAEELEAAAADPGRTGVTSTSRPAPQRPTDDAGNVILSEGERQALEARGVTTSPFTGETLNALDEGVDVQTPEARRRAERAQQLTERVPAGDWPLSGPPPAEGGRVDLEPR